MEWIGLNELREKFLSFFESKGHLRLPSFSLIPQNDKSLLLINSGMAPMKKYFTGEITPPSKRVTTCQKCVRTPDIERVGKTARHGTYFEMLGNFSFGDYFKREATAWAWEFCTNLLEMPEDRIWISIYEKDDEAFDIWTKEVGVSPERIVRMGKEDNFWEHGSGPCGPCSELYFDRGEQYGCDSPTCAVGCECDRYVEFWNNVFTQFNSDGKGNYTPLAHPNIDTGMGLERLACIMQGVDNLFEVDTVQNIMKHISSIAGVKYGDSKKTDISLRVITDHIRSTTFMIGDGVMPSNEGRGYVVRRLLRRAARHGRLLGINNPFLCQVCETVIKENLTAYPELNEKKDFIQKIIHVEEEAFGKTIDSGLSMLDEMLSAQKGNIMSGTDAFKLNDTYGFPLDLTKDILEEKGMTVDETEFDRLMAEQRARARAARKNAGADAWKGSNRIFEQLLPGSFVGYDTMSLEAKVTAIVRDDELVESLFKGETGIVILDTTPFYAEGGGQAGDIGEILNNETLFNVTDTTKSHNGVYIHIGTLIKGELRVGDAVTASVNKTERRATMRNHTAAHLLQAALRKVLGNHVEQAGQLVDSKRLRFDFSHFSALSQDELAQVELLVNQWILQSLTADIREMPIEEAKKQGAMALFGEKYGDIVRVVCISGNEGVSTELCGGTHMDNTAKLGLFKIMSESSVAAGVRRIEAVTGDNVLGLIEDYRRLLGQTADAIKSGNIEELPRRANQLMGELKGVQRELDTLNAKMAASKIESLFDNMTQVGCVRVSAAVFTGVDASGVRTMCDRCRDIAPNDAVVVIAGVIKDAGTVSLGCFCAAQAVACGAHAGNIVREVAKICGGNGGGRPDSAMAGGKDITKADEAIAAVSGIVEKLLKGHL
ncbi:MAG: alanine--tRNA ligase [Oscillospiraceae bacterium]|nr:alanine--tRNA ligase [Oscillospiraceae bacterium]MDD3832643.1 alanine--tRNA ligase [Oscillospiraceae bacterium]